MRRVCQHSVLLSYTHPSSTLYYKPRDCSLYSTAMNSTQANTSGASSAADATPQKARSGQGRAGMGSDRAEGGDNAQVAKAVSG